MHAHSWTAILTFLYAFLISSSLAFFETPAAFSKVSPTAFNLARPFARSFWHTQERVIVATHDARSTNYSRRPFWVRFGGCNSLFHGGTSSFLESSRDGTNNKGRC